MPFSGSQVIEISWLKVLTTRVLSQLTRATIPIYKFHTVAAFNRILIQISLKQYFPFGFDFRKGNSFNERGGCTEKQKWHQSLV